MATARATEAGMVDIGMVIGSLRRFGPAGPPYEVVGPAAPSPSGEAQMRIHLLESGEEVDYLLSDILNDPADA